MKNKKAYDILIYSILNSKNNINNTISSSIIQNKEEFYTYFKDNLKKSTFLAQILPSILFLIISLISLGLVWLCPKNQKFWVYLKNENLILPLLFFGLIFLLLSIILIIQRTICKVRIIKIQGIYKSGYYNVTNDKYNEIVELIKR